MQSTENTIDIERAKSKDNEQSPITLSVLSNLDLVAREDGVSAVYEAKSQLSMSILFFFHPRRLTSRHARIGFGRYQIQLFLLTGLGWAADNIWLQGVAIILPQIQKELNPSRVEFTTLSLYVGLILGATTWGILADLIGRKVSFNITLFIAGVFGVAAGGSNNFTTLGALVACVGFGIGGNFGILCILGALLLEHIPRSHQWLLTLLSAWWALGQLFASVVAWPLIGNFSCENASFCPKETNMGWRCTFYILGGVTVLMWIMRYVVFDLQESSKYLIAKGRDEEALQVLQRIAVKNGKTLTLTLSQLQSISGNVPTSQPSRLSTTQILVKALSSFSLSHITPLFSTRRLAINTTITILLWGLIGLAYPLFNGFITLYLTSQVKDSDGSVSTTYRNYTIISAIGVPGSILACLVVDWTRKNPGKFALGGRKLTLAISTALTGIFLYLFTTSTTNAAVLGYSCASGLTENAMYGVLYAYTPEVFPAPHRGTGNALCSAFNRITGILAPVIKIVTTNVDGSSSTGTANGPVFVSATLFIVSGVLTLLLPIETAGKAAL
ncbi:MFS general substrate transporter [Dendrothele bispora CBS 962.96]|uniref:MFS general substrate transporter n=1 Tax=Dendrothele bispora (strain CBS 962.96) TaxID=1314807 RepID=A0A4S8MS77_DENBC|nr:MFS general substrate transporter [Dendrothele bispora CBS 962.96]